MIESRVKCGAGLNQCEMCGETIRTPFGMLNQSRVEADMEMENGNLNLTRQNHISEFQFERFLLFEN